VYAVSLKVKSAVKSQNPPRLKLVESADYWVRKYTIVSMSDESNALDETLGRLWGYGDAVYKAEASSEL
jgi:hypothetical protein